MYDSTKTAKVIKALIDLVEGNLAELELTAMKIKPPIKQAQRQIRIVQRSIDSLREIGYSFLPGDRSYDVAQNHRYQVEDWYKFLRS